MANKGAKIMAILALVGIIVSVVGTGILYFVESNRTQKVELTPEQIEEMMKDIEKNNEKTSSGETDNGTGDLEENIETLSGSEDKSE